VIVQDINLVLSDGWVRSGYAVCPAKIGLAPELFGLLASKRFPLQEYLCAGIRED
jgi:hypothetical protein